MCLDINCTHRESVTSSSEILPNYGSIFRCDRVGKNGGGVLVAVKAGIQVTH